jgi:hypothetical protein
MERLSITGAAFVEVEATAGGLDVLVDVTDQDGRDHSLRADVWPYHVARVAVERGTEYSPPVDEVEIDIDLSECAFEDYGDGFDDPVTVKLDKAGARMVEELLYEGPVFDMLESAARQAVADGGW